MKFITAFLLSTLLLFSGCINKHNGFDATGIFEATEIIVSAETQGKILKFGIKEGFKLKADTVIGKIDNLQLQLQKKQLIANMKATQSKKPDIEKQLAPLEQQLATAKSEKNRIENLLKVKATNQKQLDDISAQIAFLEKQLTAQKTLLQNTVASLQEQVSAFKIQIQQLDDLIKKCYITNPIQGTVLTKYAEENEITMPGKPLYKIADLEDMFLKAYITADQLTRLTLGQGVVVYSDFGPKGRRKYQGKISWISSQAEFTPKSIQTRNERANLVYAVRIAVKNDGFLKIGMYGELKFHN